MFSCSHSYVLLHAVSSKKIADGCLRLSVLMPAYTVEENVFESVNGKNL